jgi:peptide methionine sulfoxide reductase MsrA
VLRTARRTYSIQSGDGNNEGITYTLRRVDRIVGVGQQGKEERSVDSVSRDLTVEVDLGHAEAVEVTFDPDRLSYRELLEYFFMVHRADLGEDVVGSGYRSEVFHTSEEQRVVAEETIRDVDASGHWPGKVMTRVSKAGHFWEEAPGQQDYLQRFPLGCRAPFPRQGEPATAFLNRAK